MHRVRFPGPASCIAGRYAFPRYRRTGLLFSVVGIVGIVGPNWTSPSKLEYRYALYRPAGHSRPDRCPSREPLAERRHSGGGKPVDLRNHRIVDASTGYGRIGSRRSSALLPDRYRGGATAANPVARPLPSRPAPGAGRSNKPVANRHWVVCSGAAASSVGASAEVESRTERGAGSPNVAAAPATSRDVSTLEMPVSGSPDVGDR